MMKILTTPFAVEYNWWAPVDLLQRLLFIIVLVISLGNLVRSYCNVDGHYIVFNQ